MKVENIRVAEANLEGESEMTERRNQIAIIKSTEHADTQLFYEEKLKEHQSDITGIGLPNVLHSLQSEVIQLNKTSETMVESVNRGQITVDDFLESYCQSRKEYHKKDLLSKSAVKLLS